MEALSPRFNIIIFTKEKRSPYIFQDVGGSAFVFLIILFDQALSNVKWPTEALYTG